MCLATSCLVLEEYYQEYCRVNTGWTQGSNSTKEKKQKKKKEKKLKKKETKPSNGNNNNNNNNNDNNNNNSNNDNNNNSSNNNNNNIINKRIYRLTLSITMDWLLFIERVENRLKYD